MIKLTNTDLHLILDKLILVVEQANTVVMDIYKKDFKIDFKDDESPLTDADNASNEIICKGLQIISPDIPIISEENKEIPFTERSTFDYCWIVDPLDGTKEFVKKNDEFAINVALCYKNKIVLAVVGTPVEQGIAWAISGHGAFYRINNGITCRLHCGSFDPRREGVRVLASRSHLSKKTELHMGRFTNPVIIPKGSSWKFLMIANNEADYYARLGPTMEWDTAAPQLILEEAGGSMVGLTTQLPLTYNKENLLNPDFIAQGIIC